MAELKLEESHDEGEGPKVIYCEGFIDSATAVQLRNKFDDLLARQLYKVVIDFTKVTYIGSAGISVFLEYGGTLQAKGGGLVICSVPEKAFRVMSMVGMDVLIRVFELQRDAVAFFTQTNPLEEAPPAAPPLPVAAKFPFEAACPHCQKTAVVPQTDVFRCQFCQKLLFVNQSGTLYPIPLHEDTLLQKGKWFKLTVPSNIIYLNSARAFLTSILGESGMSDDDIADIELAVDEAVSNVMEHAYGMDKTKDVNISFLLTDEYMLIKLRDTGESFDLVAKIKEEETRVQTAEKRGRGCYIIQQVMDKLDYQSIPGVGNELVMLRYFKRRSGTPADPHG